MNPKPFTHLLFDWGDTLMYDDPAQAAPMAEWPQVRAVPGAREVLARLKARGKVIVVATSAAVSDEAQIRGALARAELAGFVDKIFCFKNTGLPKGEHFYRRILDDLGIPASQALMVGDSFEKDVLAANAAGVTAVWFNEKSAEARQGERHATFHSLEALAGWLESAA
jgi:putative hydrolase of the HAD superfamily